MLCSKGSANCVSRKEISLKSTDFIYKRQIGFVEMHFVNQLLCLMFVCSTITSKGRKYPVMMDYKMATFLMPA